MAVDVSVMEVKPVQAIVRGQPQPKPGVAFSLRLLAERMRSAIHDPEWMMTDKGPAPLNMSDIDELRLCADELSGLADALSERESVVRKWKCRNCGKTMMEHSVAIGNVYKYCEDCRNPKVMNYLIDGEPQVSE